MHDSTARGLDDVENSTSENWHKTRQALDLESPPPPHMKPVQPRYCYRSFSDSICYNKPLVGQEDRLIAYQDKGSVGYVIDPPQKKKYAVKTDDDLGDLTPVTPEMEEETARKLDHKAASVTKTTTVTKTTDIAPEQKHLKEITFDPSELEPKKLVPDKMQ